MAKIKYRFYDVIVECDVIQGYVDRVLIEFHNPYTNQKVEKLVDYKRLIFPQFCDVAIP